VLSGRFDFYRSIDRKSIREKEGSPVQSLPSRLEETNPVAAEAIDPVDILADDLEKLNGEILAVYKANLPPAIIHQIMRGAREQAAIGGMMLLDCRQRAADGKLEPKHLANARKWNAGVLRWIENRQTTYTTGSRRKLYVIRSRRQG
jgi:hypothetical protein